jgi:hypothetical protein
MKPFYQVALIVRDIEAAMDELSCLLGASWSGPHQYDSGQWKYRLAMSLEGPPHLELVESVPGSPWDATDGPRVHHVQWWTPDIDADTRRFAREGIDPQWDLGSLRYFFAPQSGLRIELLQGSSESADAAPPNYRAIFSLPEENVPE